VAGLGRTHEDVGGVSGGRGSHLLLLLLLLLLLQGVWRDWKCTVSGLEGFGFGLEGLCDWDG
jgi:hypothetical protein